MEAKHFSKKNGRLSRGQMVQLAGFRSADATWVKVILPDGRQGWNFAGLLQSSIPYSSFAVEPGQSPPADSPAVRATVATSFLNVRLGPGVGFPVITAAPRGTVVGLLGRNTSATWTKVSLPSGTQGWVNASYLNSAIPIATLSIVG